MNPRHRAALLAAIAADVVQIALFPLFIEGAFSPLDATVDVVMCVLLFRIFGWSYVILPTFIVELLPIATEIPSWTAATLFLINRRNKGNPSIK